MSEKKMQNLIDRSPFHCWLGLKITDVSPHKVVISLPWKKEFAADGDEEHIHGGILASLIDLTGFYAVYETNIAPIYTIDLQVDYHKPAVHEMLIATGVLKHSSKSRAVSFTEVRNEEGVLISSGRGAYKVRRSTLYAKLFDARIGTCY